MEQKFIYIGKDRYSYRQMQNLPLEYLSVRGIKVKKDFLLTIDKLFLPYTYDLLYFSKKGVDIDFLVDKTNKHYCEITNPYIPNIENLLTQKYVALRDLSYSVMITMRNGKYGLIDEYGNTLLQIEYNKIWPTSMSSLPYLVVESAQGSYIYHVLKNQIVSNIYDKISIIAERFPLRKTIDEYLKVHKNGRCGLIHENGSEITPPIYDDCVGSHWFRRSDKEHKYIIVSLNEKKGIINEFGNEIAEIKYDKIQIFYPGHVDAKNLKASGWIGEKEYILIDPGVTYRKKNLSSTFEKPTYERYQSSYAQNEMGYNDDEIDTIFDGDPDAYWNID